jgi:hypothetical protein
MIFRSPVITCPDGEPQHINWKHNFKIIMDAVEDYARRWTKREVMITCPDGLY